MKPLEHAKLNAQAYGGVAADYIKVHEVMDSSKQGLGNKLHRAVYHHTHFIYNILPLIFGSVLVNSDGKEVSITQLGEDHLIQDMGGKFLPTISDWLANLPMENWMDNGQNGYPPSYKTLEKQSKPTEIKITDEDKHEIMKEFKKYRTIPRNMPFDDINIDSVSID